MGSMIECAKCGNHMAIGALQCPRCNTRRAATNDSGGLTRRTRGKAAVLRISHPGSARSSTGPIRLPEGEPVLLGRIAPDPIGTALNAFDDVSREHATLVVYGLEVEIRDSSMFGTYVNDQLVPADSSVRRMMPVRIRLAHTCYLEVNREE
jgi:pSer/pThr/pTyr-binding forkhead associated (FHA) protein